MELNESPVFLLFHTQQNVIRKDLPVSLYESGKQANPFCAASNLTATPTYDVVTGTVWGPLCPATGQTACTLA